MTTTNDVVTLTAEADPGWHFGQWSVTPAAGTHSTLYGTAVALHADKSVTVTFIDTQPDYILYLPLLLQAGTGRAR